MAWADLKNGLLYPIAPSGQKYSTVERWCISLPVFFAFKETFLLQGHLRSHVQ